MRWSLGNLLPWHQPQTLGLASTASDGYTHQILDGFQQQAIGTKRAAIGALEHAAGVVGRSLAMADVRGTNLLTPEVLRDIGRDLIRQGQSFFLFDVHPTPMLHRASWANVYGGYRRGTWLYDLTLSAPTDTETNRYPAARVIHVRYATEPSQPWIGLDPLHHATLTGTLAARLEAGLGDEVSVAMF